MSEAEALREVILPSMDRMFAQLVERLAGMGEDEYLWEPVPGMWSVRETEHGPRVDDVGMREADPPAVPTIAWRLWHIAARCFDDYTQRFAGDQNDVSADWTLDPTEAISRLEAAWATYRDTITSRDFDAKLGANWGPWAEAPVAAMAMHASNELVHHGAEVALLRDLYRDRSD